MLGSDLPGRLIPPQDRCGGTVVEGNRPDGEHLGIDHGEPPARHRQLGSLSKLVPAIADARPRPSDELLGSGNVHHRGHSPVVEGKRRDPDARPPYDSDWNLPLLVLQGHDETALRQADDPGRRES